MIVNLRWTLLSLLLGPVTYRGNIYFWIPLIYGLKKNNSHSIVKPHRRINLELEKRIGEHLDERGKWVRAG
jgi:hypothetical protein